MKFWNSKKGDALSLVVFALFVFACSGVAQKTKKSADPQPVRAQNLHEGLNNYRSWKPLSDAPMIRGGDGVQWALFGVPSASFQNGRFSPGTILVKEVRAITPSGSAGELVRLAVMKKGRDGLWSYEAYSGKGLEKDSSIDTDGCTLCHEDKSEDDFTFRARSIYDTTPSLAPPP